MEKLKILINKYHYGKTPQGREILFVPFLKAASVFYFFVISIKNLLYKFSFLKEKHVKPFVICVGNLTTGGVGKTPIVCEIANFCTNVLNKKTAVISRGYGAKLNNKNVNVIKNQNGIHYTNGSLCGDEALLIANNTDSSIVLTCRDRLKAANLAYNTYGCRVVILDDGFSNRKIYKNFSILAIDSKKQFGRGTLLPDGPLREPVSEVKRADFAIIVNKENSPADKSLIAKKIKTDKITVCNMEAKQFHNIKNSLEIIPQKQNAAAFCAIGQPEQFYQYLDEYFNILFTKSFADHHSYSGDDIKQLENQAVEAGAEILVTTQKDEVKIKPLLNNNKVCFTALKLALKFEDEKLFNTIEKEIINYEAKQNL